MKIKVPHNISSAALGGNTTVLAKVAEAFTALREAQAEAEAAFLHDIAQVLADGLARQHGSMAGAEMKIEPDGSVVVYVGEDTEDTEDEVNPDPAAPADPTPTGSRNPNLNGKFPSIGELRTRAETAGVDISDLDGRRQKEEMLARIEAAENAPKSGIPQLPDGAKPVFDKAPEGDPEPEAEEPEEVEAEEPDDPEALDPEDDLLGDLDEDDDLTESPENVEGASAIMPPSDEDLDVDNWLDD